ncbi:hypothetical protein [Thermoflexibacter ruber]|uniref:Uncharacterized protein n=1 Tax=Thermoflexibacter ruber TaxID=1003 RepID=A0A1I2C1T3_9BACT|nr:hypothetical protein [Thermoflexibacter ruber]SFE62289.1 hypothetical protein SAMN04488541_100439 [Thermoflexibacter ruber]
MKKISYWAKNHVWLSRISIIILCHFLVFLGIGLGVVLFAEVEKLSWFWEAGLVGAISYLFWVYLPERNLSYRKRTTVLALIYCLCFFICVFVGNRLPERIASWELQQTSSYDYQVVAASISPAKVNKKATKREIRQEYRKAVKNTVKQILQDWKKQGSGAKVILIILSVLLALVVFLMLAALSCSIACAGNEVLAVLVLLGGTGLIVWGAVVLIRSIVRKYRTTA